MSADNHYKLGSQITNDILKAKKVKSVNNKYTAT